jgi:hypothetical protein
MTDLDPNQRIARLMGWRVDSTFGEVTLWRNPEGDYEDDGIPNYFSPDLPIGERLKMWEKLTSHQRREFVKSLWREHSPAIFDIELIQEAFAMPQDQFASTFLRVVEGKG